MRSGSSRRGKSVERFPERQAVGVGHPPRHQAQGDVGPTSKPFELSQGVPGHSGRTVTGIHVVEHRDPQGNLRPRVRAGFDADRCSIAARTMLACLACIRDKAERNHVAGATRLCSAPGPASLETPESTVLSRCGIPCPRDPQLSAAILAAPAVRSSVYRTDRSDGLDQVFGAFLALLVGQNASCPS